MVVEVGTEKGAAKRVKGEIEHGYGPRDDKHRVETAKVLGFEGFEPASVMRKKREPKGTAPASKDLAPRGHATLSPRGEMPGKLTKVDENLVEFQQAFGAAGSDLSVVLALQAGGSLGYPAINDAMTLRSTRAAVQSLQARDGLETLLAVQMVSLHNLAMTFLAKAAIREQPPEGVELYANLASRLLRIFTGQVETLKTYRSKGEQRVAVEHVHIHRGGQAIVGAVSHSAVRDGGGDETKSRQ